MLSPDRIEVNQAFFEERIRAALAVRQKHLPGATSFRVVNAESDFLSGLIVDKYEDVLVVQISSLGMDQRKPLILAALQEIFSPRAIVERSEVASRKFEGLPEANGVLAGTARRPGADQLNGLQFEVDVLGGHKTGLYLDQQVNYQRVAELAKGGQVLDCFSFLGGFGLHAARAGAAHVHLLDQSAEAIAAATRNAAANDLADKCSSEAVNVFDWLKAQTLTTAAREGRSALGLDRARSAVVHAQPRFRAGRLARLQGNPSARAEAAQDRRHAGDLLLLAPRGCRVVPGHRALRRVRRPAHLAARGDLLAIARPSDHPDDSGDGVFEGVCVRGGALTACAAYEIPPLRPH